MSHSTNRRQFLGASAAAAIAATFSSSNSARAEDRPKQEFYELRTFGIAGDKEHAIVQRYIEKAFMPALKRMGVDRIGVFTRAADPKKETDLSIDMLIPYKSLETLTGMSKSLFGDAAYVAAAKEYFDRPTKQPIYTRLDSRLMKAFASIPVLELPDASRAKTARVFELRIYESHNEDAAFRKVDMFDQGETQIMRDVGLAPVFFGETLISQDVPNLTYMLSAPDMDAHRAHWKAFGGHPEWNRIKKMAKYKGTVSKITNRFLIPTSYSQV